VQYMPTLKTAAAALNTGLQYLCLLLVDEAPPRACIDTSSDLGTSTLETYY